ncbi:RDD family protein [Oerskovia sp. NPDC060287]|uniref:RDD family protein n=1 Tax=Oerskovia sp. NPDC060287 TaxID=3347095 RepID=UPI003651639E
MGDIATTPAAHHDVDDLSTLDPADTPPFGPYARWSRRVVAFLLDNAILAGLMFVAVGPGLAPSMLPGLDNDGSLGLAVDDLRWSESAWMLGAVIAMTVFQAYTGATPGKRAVGIVVVNRDSGRPVGLVTTVLRWLAHFLDAILCIGYLRPLWDEQRRTFADSLLSTVVVQSRSPAPHPWIVPLVRPGRPGRPGAQVVTASAAVLCTAGALFAVGPTSSMSGNFASSAMCTSWDPATRPGVPQLSEATFTSTGTGTISRWGVTHVLPPTGEGSEITLDWDGPLPLDADVSLEAVLTSPDGSRLEYSTPLDTAGTGFGADPTSPGTIEIPANDLLGIDAGWSWSAQMRVDGVAIPGCGGRAPF